MKTCKICNQEKELEDFPFHNKSKGTHRPECKECYQNKRRENYLINKETIKQYNSKSYEKHKQSRIESISNYRKNNKEKVKKWSDKYRDKRLQEYLSMKDKLKCEKCGENHIATLDFHHLDPLQKDKSVTKFIYSPKKLEQEINKCIVLCSNCHRKLHWKEKNNIN